MGHSPWGRKESDTTEWVYTQTDFGGMKMRVGEMRAKVWTSNDEQDEGKKILIFTD